MHHKSQLITYRQLQSTHTHTHTHAHAHTHAHTQAHTHAHTHTHRHTHTHWVLHLFRAKFFSKEVLMGTKIPVGGGMRYYT